MINYIIINGTNSNTINGLGINELPPISKPPLRVQTEEIDGRDGDISTNLGYGAYDKTITIGLFGTGYDINEVISFFNGEGTVVFSNEPNKYYKYKIINQIDYEALLKFKSATITFHCQPFKYSLTETPLEIEYEYIEQEGVESATMNNTNGGTSLKIDLKGNTSQTGTPTPDTPIPINVVSGDNTIKVYPNLYPLSLKVNNTDIYKSKCSVSIDNNEFVFVASGTDIYFGNVSGASTPYQEQYGPLIEIPSNATNAYIETSDDFNFNYMQFYDSSKIRIDRYQTNAREIPTGAKYLSVRIGKNNAVSGTTYRTQIKVYFDSNIQTYPINLGELELCKIGDYQDYFTKNSGKNLANIRNIPDKTTGARITIENDTIKLFDNANTGGYVNSQTPLKTICPDLKVGDIAILSFNTTSSVSQRNRIYFADASSYWDKDGELTITQEMLDSNIALYGGYNETAIISQFMIRIKGKTGIYEPYGTGQWCKYNAIEKVVLDGTEGTWNLNETNTNTYRFTNQVLFDSSNKPLNYQASILMNNYFQEYNGNQAIGSIDSEGIAIRDNLAGLTIRANILRVIDLNGFKTWLSTHNTTVYYVLATPYLSLIEDETLISQLDNIQNAMSYDGTTNIGQVNNDKPFLLDLIAMEKGTDEVVINNIGNVYAKPTIALEGTGETDIYLNNTEILKVDLSEKNKITIDTNNMEAYDPTDNSLANRKVIGNYNSMTLPSGNTTMKITGALDKATITNYQRWL